jgi:hypothetical protein
MEETMHIEITTKTQVPAWESAPGWAKYRAIDPDGAILFFENKPDIDVDGWICSNGKFEIYRSKPFHDGWSTSLEGRQDAI